MIKTSIRIKNDLPTIREPSPTLIEEVARNKVDMVLGRSGYFKVSQIEPRMIAPKGMDLKAEMFLNQDQDFLDMVEKEIVFNRKK